MKVIKIDDNIINLATVEHMYRQDEYVSFIFINRQYPLRIEVANAAEAKKILAECYEIMKKED